MDDLLPPKLPEPPPDDSTVPEIDECRLWIGNVDTRITEFALLKVLQKHGTLEKFDFLYHKSGPDQGKPRGYCFVTYKSKEEAQKALQKLNGKLALSKRLLVKPAHADKKDESVPQIKKPTLPVPSATNAVIPEVNLSTTSKIKAIEEKLALMDRNPEKTPRQAVWHYDPEANKPQPPAKPLRKPYERPRQRRR